MSSDNSWTIRAARYPKPTTASRSPARNAARRTPFIAHASGSPGVGAPPKRSGTTSMLSARATPNSAKPFHARPVTSCPTPGPSTPDPTPTTSPQISWPGAPGGSGYSIPGTPRQAFRSEPHTPHAWILTRTSPASGDGSLDSITATSPGARTVSARTRPRSCTCADAYVARNALMLKFVIFGLTMSSAWANGHATPWRALLKGLHQNGHSSIFFEHDVEYYTQHRDLVAPSF